MSDAIRQVVMDMAVILTDRTATEEEREQALDTIEAAFTPLLPEEALTYAAIDVGW